MSANEISGDFSTRRGLGLSKQFLSLRAFLLHLGLFFAGLLIGIARYSYSVPAELTALMTVWSLVLLAHGIGMYRTRRESGVIGYSRRDGILMTGMAFVSVNAIMWVMWTLSTDAQASAPWHVGVWFVFVALAAIGLIVGKRALYRHWRESFLREYADQLEAAKPKREYAHDSILRLAEDGEFADDLEDADDSSRSIRSSAKR